MANDYKFIIDNMVWSYTRLNGYYECPYEWLHHYIEQDYMELDGFFSQFGTFCHTLIERYIKGEIPIYEISNYYESDFEKEVTITPIMPSSPDFKNKCFQAGLQYFENFDLHLENYNVLGVEKPVEFELEGIPITGKIDLLLEDKNSGKITIMDHKSTDFKLRRDGEPVSESTKKISGYKKQVYMYSIPILQEYGHVDYLKWNFIRGNVFYTIPFDTNDLEKTKHWILNTIDKIKNDTEWKPNLSFMYCANMCSMRMDCPYRQEDIDSRRKGSEDHPFTA